MLGNTEYPAEGKTSIKSSIVRKMVKISHFFDWSNNPSLLTCFQPTLFGQTLKTGKLIKKKIKINDRFFILFIWKLNIEIYIHLFYIIEYIK